MPRHDNRLHFTSRGPIVASFDRGSVDHRLIKPINPNVNRYTASAHTPCITSSSHKLHHTSPQPAPASAVITTSKNLHDSTVHAIHRMSQLSSHRKDLVSFTSPPRSKRKATRERNPLLQDFKRTRLGIDTSLTPDQHIGKSPPQGQPVQCQSPPPVHLPTTIWPSATKLRSSGFGRPSKRHNFRQTACFETTFICLFKSKFLDESSLLTLCSLHPLIHHLCAMIERLKTHDFSVLATYNLSWSSQQEIPKNKAITTLAALLHYDGRVSDVMRFAGNNYTGEYRNIKKRIKQLEGLVDKDLLLRYYDVMTLGAPTEFTAETTRENAMLHLQRGNHPSVALKHEQVMKTMNKEERNNFVIAFPNWMARFALDLFFTPQHILVKPNKSDRQITDASRRYTPTSVPVNMMTSTKHGVELNCDFGDTLTKLLVRIWNLRITYPYSDIILHANDVKSCFRQLKHHPDVA